MQRYETQRRRAYIVRLTIAQLIVTLVGMVLGYMLGQSEGLLSVLLGALVALLPQAFFIQRMGIFHAKRRTRGAIHLFRAEAGKFGLTVALFVAVFVVAPPSNPALFFYAYVAVVLTHWLTPWLMPRDRTTN
ncbi:ATP synthase subunit I [Vreelandella neptunia]|uniref:ATP synthase subunit I n=1 Tax=Vreelandella neptunia TaxID=115551 RepID=A0ABS9S5A4_9GAMM|nr:ATP synthase subunit I [Halomonas neptunia]MCH4811269.1 ATP synthase subunit I [Halomonas neptunia]